MPSMISKLPKLLGLMCCLAASARAASLQVDQDRSRIQVDAKATGHSFTGTLKKYTATASGDSSSLVPEGFALGWSFKDLDTAEKDRDKQMIQWLGGGDPKGSFKFIKSWTDSKGGLNAQGTLTINGVTKTISFPYTVKKEGNWVTVDGTVSMNYQDFKLPIIRAMAVMTVDPKLNVRFHVVGKIN